MVSGIAAARAGKYADAVLKLAPLVSSGSADADARYYYALSLEKTGQQSRAAEEYMRVSRGSGSLAERAYLDYCRMLAATGSRDRARQLLTQYIRRKGDSGQVVAARRLLQTL